MSLVALRLTFIYLNGEEICSMRGVTLTSRINAAKLWIEKQAKCASCFGFRSRNIVLNALASEAETLCLMLWLQKQEHCA
jgi:hypothetical protein